jgi:hypothetical protein
MKIVIRSVVKSFELSAASDRPEQTARRSITFSPSAGASVILRERVPRADKAPGLVTVA